MGLVASGLSIGALIITYTILGVYLWYSIPPNPILLIIKAPILVGVSGSGLRVLGFAA